MYFIDGTQMAPRPYYSHFHYLIASLSAGDALTKPNDSKRLLMLTFYRQRLQS